MQYIELKFPSHEDAIGPKPEIRPNTQERLSASHCEERRHRGRRVLEPDRSWWYHPKVTMNVLEVRGVYGNSEEPALDSVLFNTSIKLID